jgi:hypothetical protein
MRIQVRRSGGFGNIPRFAEIDTDSLPEEEATRLQHLVKQVNIPRLAGTRSSPGHLRDAFQYDVTIDEGGTQHTATIYQGAVPDRLQELIDDVLRLHKSQPD